MASYLEKRFEEQRNYVLGIDNRSWLRDSLLARGALSKLDEDSPIYYSTADTKYTDTTLGGNFAINPPPQWTRSADIKRRGRSKYGHGMGRAYSERIDDYSQLVHMRLGVASFNSLSTFVGNFYNHNLGTLSRTGRGPGVMFMAGKAVGFVVAIAAWKIQALMLIGQGVAFFLEKGSTRFYKLKPTMPIYWNTVQTIVNQLAVNLGVSPRAIQNAPVGNAILQGYQFTEGDANRLREAFPGLFTRMGSIDVWALANRSQRMYINQISKADNLYGKYEGGIKDSLENDIRELYQGEVTDPGRRAYVDYLDSWLNTAAGTPEGVVTDEQGQIVSAGIETINSLERGDVPRLVDYYEAELYDGSAFITFRVNYTGSVSDSVSNQSGESDIGNTLNGLVSKAKEATFAFAGGNIAPGVGEVIKMAGNFVSGALDSFGLTGVVNAAVGGAFVDIPSQWKSSSASFNKSTYTIDLVSPYNHPMAKLMFQYIPMAMLMAAAFPRSTGTQSYYAPPMLEFYDQGRAQTRLGMISDLSFERGFTNLGFNHSNRAMGIRATFSIADMSNIVHVPISVNNGLLELITGTVLGGGRGAVTGIMKNIGNQMFDDESPFNDYLGVIAGLSVADQVFTLRKAKLRATRALMNWERWTSPARLAHITGDWIPSRLLSMLYPVNHKLG
ncbi:MAG: hypothetical protein M0R77_00575 [Gammaproteobacteria bacterium]|nr:hypothetical protein [Acholeplasmataceae bacterium]MCK9529048.1 hypothetical protein [Gammaproteobacteria bacterium]